MSTTVRKLGPDRVGPSQGMTTLARPVMRGLAREVLTKRTAAPADTAALAAAMQAAYDDFARVSAPLIGQVGLDSLMGRALYLVQQNFPWLAHASEPTGWSGPFEQIVSCLGQQEPAVATEAAVAIFTTVAGLLTNFIGEPFTMRVFQKAWPDAFNDANGEEK